MRRFVFFTVLIWTIKVCRRAKSQEEEKSQQKNFHFEAGCVFFYSSPFRKRKYTYIAREVSDLHQRFSTDNWPDQLDDKLIASDKS